MKKMKTIKFPNTKEAYDIYDDEAVRSINGNKPDENGEIEIRQSTDVLFQNLGGSFISSKTAAEIKDLMLSARDSQGVRFRLMVKDFTKPMGPHPVYKDTRVEEESYYTGSSYLMLKFHIYFGDNIAPVVVDCVENTIVVDPNWAAPEEVALKSEVEQLSEEIAEIKENGTGSGSGLPEVDGSNRLLMTNEYGNVIWVDGGIEPRLITSNMLTLNNPSTNRYIYDFAAVGIIEGETYTFVITPTTSDNNTYEVIQSEISAVAEITNDRFGNVAYIFNFDNINLYKNKKNRQLFWCA